MADATKRIEARTSAGTSHGIGGSRCWCRRWRLMAAMNCSPLEAQVMTMSKYVSPKWGEKQPKWARVLESEIRKSREQRSQQKIAHSFIWEKFRHQRQTSLDEKGKHNYKEDRSGKTQRRKRQRMACQQRQSNCERVKKSPQKGRNEGGTPQRMRSDGEWCVHFSPNRQKWQNEWIPRSKIIIGKFGLSAATNGKNWTSTLVTGGIERCRDRGEAARTVFVRSTAPSLCTVMSN